MQFLILVIPGSDDLHYRKAQTNTHNDKAGDPVVGSDREE